MIQNLVSIVMPLYNSRMFVAESLESVVHQTYPDWELVIIDDGSTDGSVDIAREYERNESRIRVISLIENHGVSYARNTGIAAARGRYLAFLDSDDLWLPSKLSVQLEFMKDSSAAFSFARFLRMTEQGKLRPSVPVPNQVDYEMLLRGNVIGCLTVMLDRAQVGRIEMPNIGHEDYAAWLAVLKRGYSAFGISDDLAIYRISQFSVSADKGRSALWTWRVYRNAEHLPLPKALWCFSNYVVRAVCSRM